MNKRLLLTIAILATAWGALWWVNRERPQRGPDPSARVTPFPASIASQTPPLPSPESQPPATPLVSQPVPVPSAVPHRGGVTQAPTATPLAQAVVATPNVAMPAPPDPVPEPPPEGAPAPQPPEQALEAVRTTVREYSLRYGGNPVGTNAEITKALDGGNPKGVRFLPADQRRLNENGELIDPWGTPYFFHALSAQEMETRSAGPDTIMWNADDLVTH